MDQRELDKLCGVYKHLDDNEKGSLIRLAEGLLDDQKSVGGETLSFMDKLENSELREEKERLELV